MQRQMEKYIEQVKFSSRCLLCADVFTCKRVDDGRCKFFRFDKVLKDAGIKVEDMKEVNK